MEQIYFFSDVHGVLPLYNAAMEYCGNNLIIFGGDANDRGENGYTIMKDLLSRKNVIYLKGNHEDIFVKAAKELKNRFPLPQFNQERFEQILKSITVFDYKYENTQLSLYNGGRQTLIDWFNDGMPMDIVEKIDKLPLTYSYGNLDFCHAGSHYNPFHSITKTKEDEQSLLWDRGLFNYGWAPNRICIHGHTPTCHLPKNLSKVTEKDLIPLKYRGDFDSKCTGYKIDMDVATYWSKRLYVLNCNNKQAQGFTLTETNSIEPLNTIDLS